MKELQVGQSSRILADVTIKLKDGSIADSTKASGKPSWLIMGDNSFSSAFENHLLNKKVGDQINFELESEEAFGKSNPDQIHFMDISQFPNELELKNGVIIEFEQPGGGKQPGIIRSVLGESVKIDFNHPLAGESVVFEIEIKSIVNQPLS